MHRNILMLHKCGLTKEFHSFEKYYDFFYPFLVCVGGGVVFCFVFFFTKRLALTPVGLASFLSYHIPQKEARLILSIRRLKADGMGRCFLFSRVKEVSRIRFSGKSEDDGGNIFCF